MDICQVVGGGTPSTHDTSYWQGDIPWISSADIDESDVKSIRLRKAITAQAVQESATNIVPAGTVIVVTRVGLGKVALVSEPLCFSQDSQGLLFDQLLLDALYFAYYLKTAVQVFKRISRGTTISGVTKKQLEEIDVLIPPLAEQRRIVQKIEELFTELDAGVAALERVRANLKRYRAAVLKGTVEGALTTGWRAQHPDVEPAGDLLQRILRERREAWEQAELARYTKTGKTPPKGWQGKCKEPAAPDTTDLPELPDDWCWASLPQLGTLDRGRSRHRPRNDPRLYGGTYPFIQTGDVRHANTFIREYTQTYSEAGLQQSKLWPAGTLCITIAANIAETAILSFDACFPDSVVGFLAQDGCVSTRFIEIYLRTIRDQLERYAPATAQKNINLETLNTVAVALPPIVEQEQIVAEVERRLSVAEDAEARVAAGLKRAARLRQSILKRAFAGDLVPQDPTDEPASALLERIAVERGRTARAGKAARGAGREAAAGDERERQLTLRWTET